MALSVITVFCKNIYIYIIANALLVFLLSWGECVGYAVVLCVGLQLLYSLVILACVAWLQRLA